MKERILTLLLSICLLTGMMPSVALAAENPSAKESAGCTCEVACTEDSVEADCPACAADRTQCTGVQSEDAPAAEPEATPVTEPETDPEANGDGLTAESPMPVPVEEMVIVGNTYYGISKAWYEEINPEKTLMYFSIAVPGNVTAIAKDGFRDQWSNEKQSHGVITDYNYDGDKTRTAKYKLVSIDFSNATALTTIKSQAAMGCSYLTGVLDLSKTVITTLEKSAFSGCTGLTGVILPNTLTVLGDATGASGSVFNGCTDLQFVRTAGGSETAVFELPDSLTSIGKQCFQGCTGFLENTTVVIPASVTSVGSEAFDETESAIGTIVVKANNASGYDGGAFKDNDTGYGLGKRLIVFNSAAAKNTFKPSGFTTYQNACTYEFRLHYGEVGGTDVQTESKLWGQAVNVCKKDDGSWAVNTDYEIPKAESGDLPIGYEGGWAYNDKLLTTATVLKPDGDDLYLTIQQVLQDPTVEFIVNGEVIETEGTSPELRVPAGSTIGVQVSHPVEDVDVKFEYEWIDVWKGGHEGPRMEEDGFGRYDLCNNPDVANTITINGITDERTSAGKYTDEDYGDGYYLLVIYGYSKPKSGGQWTKFYQSANTAIAPDPGRTVDTAYLFYITVAEPIAITPADITIYTGGEGYTGVVNDSGGETSTANGFPEPGYYITLPNYLNEQLGGDANAEDLSKILTFKYDDGKGATREWKLEPYGTDAHSSDVEDIERQRYIYRMLPGVDEDDKEIPVRMQITDPETGTAITSDEFTPSLTEQYQEFTMSIYSGELDKNKITAELTLPTGETVTSKVESADGTLSVRGLNNEATTEIVNEKNKVSGEQITAVARDDVTYYVNGSNVAVADPSGVKLLVDEVLDDGVLTDYIEKSMADIIPAGDYTYAQQYLDLVDTKNGNAYLTLGEGQHITVYWPVPDNFDADKNFYMIHFDGLDRNYTDIEDVLSENKPKVLSDAELVTVNGAQYIQFETSSFSPFVLVYEEESGGGGGTTRYTITASAGTGGEIDPDGSVRVTRGSDKTFSITPTDGYEISDVLVDGKSVGAVSSYTFENVRASHTIKAVFEKVEQVADPDDTGVSDWLNTKDHFAYLNGYDTGAFGPTNNMTRAEVAQMFYNLLLDKNVAATVSFTDVAADAWYADAVNALASIGVIKGVGNNRFAPERAITRAEFTVIAMRFADLDTSGENIFTDVSTDDWFYAQVVGSIKYGWINGYEDGTFRPDNTITRAEVTTIVNRMLGRAADEDYVDGHVDELRQFPDVSKTNWAYYNIMEATNAHEYSKSGGMETWESLNK